MDLPRKSPPTELRTHLYVTHRRERSRKECLENAELAARLAASAQDAHEYNRYQSIEDGWRALAVMQDWLDGGISPLVDQSGNAAPTTER